MSTAFVGMLFFAAALVALAVLGNDIMPHVINAALHQ